MSRPSSRSLLERRLHLLLPASTLETDRAAQVKPECKVQRDEQWLVLGGSEQPTPWGPALVLHRHYCRGWAHGRWCLTDALQPVDWAELLDSPHLRAFSAERALFVDIETTSLSHGAGTLAFLVGVGYFEEDSFHLVQLFMSDPNDEQAMLHVLCAHAEGRPHLVTFNGKSFDTHILRNRLLIQHMEPPEPLCERDSGHLDLLHPARRIYRSALPDVKLQTLERERLGVFRVGDLPSELIASRYFQYLATGDLSLLEQVFEHNRLDVLSMVTLLAHLGHVLVAPRSEDHPVALYNLARQRLRQRDPWGALQLLRSVADASGELPEHIRPRLYRVGLRACIRCRRTEVLIAWLDAWQRACPDDPLVYERLSMYHEHHEKDRQRALSYAEMALRLHLLGGRPPGPALRKRLRRLAG